MISKALKFSSEALDQFLRNRMGLDESKVILNNLIESSGSIPLANQNKVVISLINIDKETARPFHIRNVQLNGGNYADVSPSEKYNLDVLISANFDDYSETLKFLDAVLVFFQVNICFDSRSNPGMPEGLNKLEFETEKMSYHQMHSLWTAMGAKYQPSILYKIRLVTVQGNQTSALRTAILQNSNSVQQ